MARTYKRKEGPRAPRGPDLLRETPASFALWNGFVKPFLRRFTLGSNERALIDGPAHFFTVDRCPIQWCRTRVSFRMPGLMKLPEGSSVSLARRDVPARSLVIVRRDNKWPDRNEVEFEGQIFVLTFAQMEVIKEKLEVLA